jgi:hypothetical protein
MKLFLNVNLTLTLIQIKLQFSFGEFVCLFVCLFQFSFFSLFIWQTSHFDHFWFLNTETKDWHQKFLQTVLRNLLNWCKCVGRNNLNNVLYPLLLFILFVDFTTWQTTEWFDFFLPWFEMLIGFWNNLFNFRTINFTLSFLSPFRNFNKVVSVTHTHRIEWNFVSQNNNKWHLRQVFQMNELKVTLTERNCNVRLQFWIRIFITFIFQFQNFHVERIVFSQPL